MQPNADRPADDYYTRLWYNTEEQTKKELMLWENSSQRNLFSM